MAFERISIVIDLSNHEKNTPAFFYFQTARLRYDGATRNPFDEYECGHWYARAMSSYVLIEALTGVHLGLPIFQPIISRL